MHTKRSGGILVLVLSTLLILISTGSGKAFPERSLKYRNNYEYNYKRGSNSQFQPFYEQNDDNRHSQNNLYYTPRINGQPIFIPPINGPSGHINDFLDDYFKRNDQYAQTWTLATPITYGYSDNRESDYYENGVTSNSMVQSLLDKNYEDGGHRGNYHVLPVTRRSQIKHHELETPEHKEYLVPKDKSDKNIKVGKEHDHLDTSKEKPIFTRYDGQREVPSEEYYTPEIIDKINIKKQSYDDYDYSPEIVDAVNIKNHGNKNMYLTQDELVENVEDDDYDEPIVHETFSQHKEDKHKEDKIKHKEDKHKEDKIKHKEDKHKDKIKHKEDKIKHKEDKKQVKESSSSTSSSTDHSESTSKRPNKPKQPRSTKKPEKIVSSSEYTPKISTKKSGSKQTYDSSDEFYKPEKVVESTINFDNPKLISKKTGVVYTTELSSKRHEYSTENREKVKKNQQKFKDDAKNPLNEETYIPESSNPALDINKEAFNALEEPEKDLDLENAGSGTLVTDGKFRNFPNVDALRSLSSLNSNIWSLVFNPNAERNKLKQCVTRTNETGYCMYIQHCETPNMVTTLEQLINNACVMDEVFIGICCPEFPVQTVKVDWEQIPSNSDKQIEDEFGHDSEDCGIRSDKASEARSWPWKAPLVSMSNGRIFCGGVVISEDYVLTAAHCTTKIPKNQILVRLGQHDENSGEDFAVVEIKRHAQYNPRTMHNDIALLKLGRRIMHDEYTGTVCLPDEDDDSDDHVGEKAELLGWQGIFGKSTKTAEFLEVMKNKECESKLGVNVPASLLCTEARNEDERTCNADSGAPLVIEDDDKYEVIGILSWNRNDCDQRFPSTFSRVSRYVKWIQKHAV